MSGNKPIRKFKAGGITASVFENKTSAKGFEAKIYNVVVSKTFKDKEGNWKTSFSFSVFNEIPKVQLVLSKAYEYVAMLSNKEGEEDEVQNTT